MAYSVVAAPMTKPLIDHQRSNTIYSTYSRSHTAHMHTDSYTCTYQPDGLWHWFIAIAFVHWNIYCHFTVQWCLRNETGYEILIAYFVFPFIHLSPPLCSSLSLFLPHLSLWLVVLWILLQEFRLSSYSSIIGAFLVANSVLIFECCYSLFVVSPPQRFSATWMKTSWVPRYLAEYENWDVEHYVLLEDDCNRYFIIYCIYGQL